MKLGRGDTQTAVALRKLAGAGAGAVRTRLREPVYGNTPRLRAAASTGHRRHGIERCLLRRLYIISEIYSGSNINTVAQSCMIQLLKYDPRMPSIPPALFGRLKSAGGPKRLSGSSGRSRPPGTAPLGWPFGLATSRPRQPLTSWKQRAQRPNATLGAIRTAFAPFRQRVAVTRGLLALVLGLGLALGAPGAVSAARRTGPRAAAQAA